MDYHSGHPLYRAIQQSMLSITEIVVYNEVKNNVFAKELVTLGDLDEYDALENVEAVSRMTRKLMHSITNCEKFLEILKDMQPKEYKELAQLITDKSHQISAENSNTDQADLQLNEDQIIADSNELAIVPPEKVEELMQEGRTLIDTLMNQTNAKMKPIVEAMQLKRKVGKSFTEFLLYITKLFQKAIEDNTISLKHSQKKSTTSELTLINLTLVYIHKDFCSTEVETSGQCDKAIAIVIGSANKVTQIIESLQKKNWLHWLRSAKTLSALVPIFERITQVVEGVQHIEDRPFSELFGDVEALKISLDEIEKKLLMVHAIEFSGSVLVAIGSIVCLIVGGILSATPAGGALLAVGGVGFGAAVAAGGFTQFSNYIVTKYFKQAKEKGTHKGDRFAKRNLKHQNFT